MESRPAPTEIEPLSTPSDAPPGEPSPLRFVFPALAIALPILAAVAIDEYARLFLPSHAEIEALGITETIQLKEARLLAETPAQMQYVFSSLLVMMAAICGFLYTMAQIDRRFRPWIVTLAILVSSAVFISDETANAWLKSLDIGPLTWLVGRLTSESFSTGELMRLIAVDHVLEVLGAADGTQKFAWLAAVAATIGVFGVSALAGLLAVLAWPVTKSPGALRRRKRALQMTLAVSAVVLTLSVASNRAFYHWPAAMLDEPAAKAYGDMVSMASGYWGLLYTLVLIAAVTPAVMSHRRDVDAMARRKAASPDKIGRWIDDEDLRFAPRDGFGAAIAAAAPVLTSPTLDLLTAGAA